MRHGFGRLKCRECTYSGTWHNNVRHGHGKQAWQASGESYEGQWQNDKMHGEGTLVTPTIKYIGQFSNGEQDGKGLQVWWRDGGDSYEGRFHANRPHGMGVYKYTSRNEFYEGHMELGEISGEGMYSYADGSVYEGHWYVGKQNGHGRLTYKDGTIYNGQFKDDKFHGKGTYVEPSGSIYTGTFAQNIRCGEMSVLHVDGQRELRRYDSEGQEVERKLQHRVVGSSARNAKLSALGLLSPRGSTLQDISPTPSTKNLQDLSPTSSLRNLQAGSGAASPKSPSGRPALELPSLGLSPRMQYALPGAAMTATVSLPAVSVR